MKRILAICLLLSLPVAGWGTVTTQSFSVSFNCTGSTGPFPFGFPISAPQALAVIQNGTVLSSSAYTITAVNNSFSNGGSVSLNTACPSPQVLTLQRETPLNQTTAYYDNMPVPMTTLMYSLDKLTEVNL